MADFFSSRSGTFPELKHYQPQKYNLIQRKKLVFVFLFTKSAGESKIVRM
ncbi:hypothetical protein QG37_05012 [Candidozyma auris]|uniref:Uncharacterized protein n=1 Tax=Candidozyma auris TaxID=498019 RepID=A0A0L0NVP8_CANAR|nr:hypothetical protein QG37_05012 [[Candida] auris]